MMHWHGISCIGLVRGGGTIDAMRAMFCMSSVTLSIPFSTSGFVFVSASMEAQQCFRRQRPTAMMKKPGRDAGRTNRALDAARRHRRIENAIAGVSERSPSRPSP